MILRLLAFVVSLLLLGTAAFPGGGAAVSPGQAHRATAVMALPAGPDAAPAGQAAPELPGHEHAETLADVPELLQTPHLDFGPARAPSRLAPPLAADLVAPYLEQPQRPPSATLLA